MTFLEGYRSSTVNRWVQRLLRVLQFLCSIIALGLFSRRLARLIHLTRRSYNRGEGAVEGILAAATVYSILAMAMTCCLRHGGPKIIRWLFVLLDILFLGAFIAVAALTRPHNGPAGPYGGECRRDSFLANAITQDFRRRHGCNLPWGTFVLAIISCVLYALSALFHEVKDRRNRNSGYDAHGGKGSRHSTSTYNTNPEHQQVNSSGGAYNTYPEQQQVHPAGGAYNTYPEQQQATRGHHIV